jgi:hypothetical protein
VIEELIPAACHVTEQYATDEIVNPATLCEVGVCLEPFLSPGGSGLRRRSGAGVIPEAAEPVKAGFVVVVTVFSGGRVSRSV